MKKKVMSAVLAAAMVVGMAGNVVTVSAKEKYHEHSLMLHPHVV